MNYTMNTKEAIKLVGGLSKPSKMPGWAMACRPRNARRAASYGR